MKNLRKLIAALLVAAMTATLFTTFASAKVNTKPLTDNETLTLAKKALEDSDKDALYTGKVDDPVLIYYGSQFFTRPFTVAKWASDPKKQKKTKNMQDLGIGIVSDVDGTFAGAYGAKTIQTMQNGLRDLIEGVDSAPDEFSRAVAKKLPIVSESQTMIGPVGQIVMKAVLLPAYIATNVAALAFVFVGGGSALVVIFGLTGILSPVLAVMEGPQTMEQFFKDLNEIEHAVQKAK